jgi:hypothetical protein
LGFQTLFIVRNSEILENTAFQKLDLFSSSADEGGTSSDESLRKS